MNISYILYASSVFVSSKTLCNEADCPKAEPERIAGRLKVVYSTKVHWDNDMKIFHTSDWHLGVSLEHTPRHEEHKRFLDWLLTELGEKEIDVLLISGDIFHYTQPSASAQRDLFSFFAKCSTLASLRHIVLIAGNHDSPTRLDAPKEILSSLDIHVVGELEKREDALIPLTGKSGKIECC